MYFNINESKSTSRNMYGPMISSDSTLIGEVTSNENVIFARHDAVAPNVKSCACAY